MNSLLTCPVCVKQNKKSKVYSYGVRKTLMGYRTYHDEEGVYHDHNPNKHSELLICTEKHEFERKYYKPCFVSTCEPYEPEEIIILKED